MKKLLRISLSVLLVILIAAASAICAGAATSVKVNFVSDGRIFKTVTTEANGMVAGFYDLPCHRNKAFAGYLSLTMPFALWEGMQEDLDKSCLTTHAWKQIEKRRSESQ